MVLDFLAFLLCRGVDCGRSSGIAPSFSPSSQSPAPVVPRPGDSYQLEVGYIAFQSSLVLRCGDQHLPEEGLSDGFSCGSFSRSGNLLPSASFSSGQNVAAATGSHGIAGAKVCSPGSVSDVPSPVASEGLLVPGDGRSVSASSADVRVQGLWSLVASRGMVVFRCSSADSPSFSSSLLLCTDALLSGWGAHFLDLIAASVWSQEERVPHIKVS